MSKHGGGRGGARRRRESHQLSRHDHHYRRKRKKKKIPVMGQKKESFPQPRKGDENADTKAQVDARCVGLSARERRVLSLNREKLSLKRPEENGARSSHARGT